MWISEKDNATSYLKIYNNFILWEIQFFDSLKFEILRNL